MERGGFRVGKVRPLKGELVRIGTGSGRKEWAISSNIQLCSERKKNERMGEGEYSVF